MKYAFLDADFVMKAHTIRKDNTNLLIDQILNKEGYQFCCHLQTLRLRNSSQKNKCISVEFKAVIEDLYNGRLQLAPDGWLIR